MRAVIQVTALTALLASAGCHDLTDTKRWSSMRWDDNGVYEVEASVYVAPAPAAAPDASASNPVSGWSDRAQGAFVAGVATKTSGSQAFQDAILKSKSKGGGTAGGDNQKFLLVVTLTRPAGYVPGDRIARVVLRVSPINFSLGGYTVAQTARQTYSVTALTRTAGLEEDLSAAAPAGAPVTASVGLKATQGSSSVTPLTESPETLTVDMVPSCMRMVQEGAHSLDLTGDVKIAASFLTETMPVPSECRLATGDPEITPLGTDTAEVFLADSGLSFKNGKPGMKTGVSPGGLRAFPSTPLAAKVDLNYVLRRVDKGAESYDESVQAVTLRRGSHVTCQVVVPLSQMIPPLYALYGPSAAGRSGNPVSTEAQNVLVFASYDTARDAAEWMNRTGARALGPVKLAHLAPVVTAKRFEIIAGGDPCADQKFVTTERERIAGLPK